MQISYDFEEMKLPIFGEGALFYGTATLESADEQDDEFYVSSITIGRQTMTRPSRINSANVVNDFIFTEIVKQIESSNTVHGKQALLIWSDAVTEQSFERRHPIRIPELGPGLGIRSMEAAE